MKIIEETTGNAFELYPNFKLEIERTNPFFNEYGEQSLPINMPDTDVNRSLTNQAQSISNKSKATQRLIARIEDGAFMMRCRMAVLSGQRKASIGASFYLNEGAFYDSLPATKLKSIFGTETIPGITTVAHGIAFCKSLLTTTDSRFTIFPILIESDNTNLKIKWINQLAFMNSSGVECISDDPNAVKYPGDANDGTYSLGFYNEFERSETIEDIVTTIPIGYHLSPFIKANYLLTRIFQYFGYTLEDTFFSQTDPFTSMVFINNTLDAIVNGVIKFADLVPNCLCSDILNVFRKKFNCEFIPNEITKTVRIVLFKSIASSKASVDLTNFITSEPKIDYPKSYRQIKLSSDGTISDDEASNFDSVSALLSTYPNAYFDKRDQCFYRDGFAGGTYTKDRVAPASLPYMDTEILDVEEVSVPDCIPVPKISTIKAFHAVSRLTGQITIYYLRLLYIGTANRLYSTAKYTPSAMELANNTSTASATTEEKPILALMYSAGNGYNIGTLSNCDFKGAQLWNYSLCYNGPFGIFEKFYRDFDNLLRNSLNEVEYELLLSNELKRTIPAHEKVIVQGQEVLINSLSYIVGGKNDPIKSKFLTTHLFEPISEAVSESVKLAEQSYRWVNGNVQYTPLSTEQFNASPFKNKVYPINFPRLATAQDVNVAHYVQMVAKELSEGYWLITYSIKAEAVVSLPGYDYI